MQKLRDLGAQGVHVQKLRDLKSSGICRYEAILYVQKLPELAMPAEKGVAYVQKLRGLRRSGDAQSGLTAAVTSNLIVIVPDVNRKVKDKVWTKSGRAVG